MGHLLAGSVQDVQQAGLSINDDLLPVAVLYCGVILVHEMILYQLYGEGTLTHAPGPHHHQLVLRHVDLDAGLTAVIGSAGLKNTKSDNTRLVLVNGESVIMELML